MSVKPSVFAKAVVTELAALTAALLVAKGNEAFAKWVGNKVGAGLAPVAKPLLASTSSARRTLGMALVIGTVFPVSYGVGAVSAATTIGTFLSVEKTVAELLEKEDWTKLDELAWRFDLEVQRRKSIFILRARFFGVIPAIMQTLGFDAFDISEADTDFDADHDDPIGPEA